MTSELETKSSEERVSAREHSVSAEPPQGSEQVGKPTKKSVRKRSTRKLFGWPLYDIAIGPASDRGESVGRAVGIIAVGDQACGGLAIGGLSCGLISIGGCSFGLLGAVGGVAVGGVVLGGVAVGVLAMGGVAIGAWATGGATFAWQVSSKP